MSDRYESHHRSVSHRPPPDYTQRGVKLRLFLYVASIMLVVAAIERARDPRNWQWLWHLDRTASHAKPFNNRLENSGLRTAHDPPGTFVAVSDSKSDGVAANSGDLDPARRTWDEGWRDVFSRLPADRQSLLFEMLHAAAAHQALSPDNVQPASELLQQIQRLWADYQVAAFQSVAELKGDDQAQWVDLLRQVNGRFNSDVGPALQSIADRRTPTELEQNALANLETTLVKLTRAEIEDDTVVFRPAEREIWFHELARVRDAEIEQLSKASLGHVAYLQLSKQPADYRGKIVTVRGTVRLAYRAPAPANYLGVKEYCVYVLQPAGGPDAPIFIYALTAPPGFPRLGAHSGDPRAKVREDVAVTGVFFKRCAYAGQGGTYTAPLIIANVPDWRPSPAAAPAGPPFTPLQLAAMAIGALLLAICVTAVLWKRSSRRYRASRDASEGFVDLGPLALGPSPEEKIRQLERQARGGSG